MKLIIFFTFGGKKFQWKQIVAELAGIFVECSFKFISRLKAYDKIFNLLTNLQAEKEKSE